MKDSAVLIGNGLNRASDNKAWANMLDEIKNRYAVEDAGPCTNLPLEFERIYFDSRKQGKVGSAYELKQEIIRSLPSVNDLSLHERLLTLPCDHFLTTNYDYYIEKTILPAFGRRKYSSNTKERKNSTYRHIRINGKKVWHIHGEAYCPDSICLGYDQYCTYMSAMIHTLTHPPQPEPITKRPLLRFVLEGGRIPSLPWMMLFFTHDIHILGLTLSFLEIDLWWLFSYRSRFILENPKYQISNKIFYYYADYSGKISDEQMSLLEGMGVELCPIPFIRGNWRRFYNESITRIEKTMRSR